jgi:GxxExxY protein
MTENEIGTVVVDTSIAIHRELGPGLLETVYEMVLGFELTRRGLKVERQVPIQFAIKNSASTKGFAPT